MVLNKRLQAVGVGKIQNVGVVFFMTHSIGFGKFAFTDTSETRDEDLAVPFKQSMQF